MDLSWYGVMTICTRGFPIPVRPVVCKKSDSLIQHVLILRIIPRKPNKSSSLATWVKVEVVLMCPVSEWPVEKWDYHPVACEALEA